MKVSANYPLIILLCLVFTAWVFSFTDLYIISKLGLVLFALITMMFLDGMGKSIPIKELIGLILLMQLIVCPVLIYNYFDNDVQYSMDVNEDSYMDFVFAGVLFFLAGIFIPINRKKIEIHQLINNLSINKTHNGKIGIALVIIGYASTFIGSFFPSTLNFFFYLLENFKYIGVFYLLFSNNRFKYLWLIAVYGYLAYETVAGGIFVNLFIWGLLLAIILAFQHKLKLISKLLLFAAGIYIAFFVQSFKKEYREVIWEDQKKAYTIKEEGESKQKVFLDMAAERAGNTEALYEYDNFNNFISRLNQGWILTRVLKHVPAYEDFTGGETLKNDIRASIIPRIFDPGKTVAGGEQGREKFARFTGRYLVKGTRMTIGVLGDAYVNFGFTGGIIFMFIFGFFLNLVLYWIYSLSKTYPTLILWIPFIFFYAMRAGNEFIVILNFITKSSFVVFLLFILYKKHLRVEIAD